MRKRIAILCAGQFGDACTITSSFRYKKELWGEDAKIVWYIAKENMDLLKYQDVEVREFPRGFGYPEMAEEENKKLIADGKEPIWQDWQPLMNENNLLNLELAKNYPSLAEFDYGAFPAPHQMGSQQRHGLSYPLCSKKVFGVPMDWEWHPVLMFSDEERDMVKCFIGNMEYKKIICLETFAGSGQSLIEDEQIRKVMDICTQVLGGCIFIFMSHKYLRGQEEFPQDILSKQNVYSAKQFTVRQCALVVEYSHLLVSVSSGISVASVAWGMRKTPIIQFCGSEICSTKDLSYGRRFELVTHDDKILDDAYNEMNLKLTQILTEIK